MKYLKNKILKITSDKKKSKSTSLHILDKIDKIIKIKRIFFINSENKDIRGNHGHKKCTQVFVSISGNIKLEVFNGEKNKFFTLKPFIDILKVEPNNWVKVHFKRKQILMVLCDKHYSYSDYIFDKSKITKKVKNK